MALLVTLHVFSGREDPRWVLTGDEEKEFLAKLEKEGSVSHAAALDGLLGYRGFSVEETEARARKGRRLFQTQDAKPTQRLAGSPELEHFLLNKGKRILPRPALRHVDEMLARNVETLRWPPIQLRCPACVAADAPVYNPAIWNTPNVQPFNNCYNYANNRITNTFAQPGRATGHMYQQISCKGVVPAAQSDGLKSRPNFSAPLKRRQGYYVALVIWPPNVDFHWYRQDKVGCWSHKPGGTAARNIDNSGHAISDPKTCDRGPYKIFCTYMLTGWWAHIA